MSGTNEHFEDACYEVWRRGGNPDRVDRDRSDNDFYDGRTPEFTANREIRQIQDARARRLQQEAEEEYWSQMQQQEYPEPEQPEAEESSDDLPL